MEQDIDLFTSDVSNVCEPAKAQEPETISLTEYEFLAAARQAVADAQKNLEFVIAQIARRHQTTTADYLDIITGLITRAPKPE
jgi:hypothetical protein